MRIHVTANGKPTSISVDETLIDYMGAKAVLKRPNLHTDAQRQFELAKEAIQEFVRESKTLPEKNLSQYVQSVLIQNIASSELQASVDARGSRHTPAKPKNTAAVSNPAEVDKVMNELFSLNGKAPRT